MSMPLDKAEHYRRKAEECLEQAELFPDEAMKSRMRGLAGEWLQMAARAALKKDGELQKREPLVS
jgi:hypothetical protein